MSKWDGLRSIVNGHQLPGEFPKLVDKFIDLFVLCPNCLLPEKCNTKGAYWALECILAELDSDSQTGRGRLTCLLLKFKNSENTIIGCASAAAAECQRSAVLSEELGAKTQTIEVLPNLEVIIRR